MKPVYAMFIALGFYTLNKFVGDMHLTILYFVVLTWLYSRKESK
jgi:hypothetical protein